ncbi:GntR family transcriptional regulator [Caldimonas tepidiphila]|uniref:GntR family transcriptional regulator n=1 Tax=Caldimonas tepidiphila TaxID=2315841 RepID=UPI000E5BD1A8|nr:GntR family transcriptional regulator [Caldimonas tepidiphila]
MSTRNREAPVEEGAQTATDRVYAGIYRAVLERRLVPGEWLREEELAGIFGVSRTVVRQALNRLAQNQIVELLHNRGARVPQPRFEEAKHVFEARQVVECQIARQLAGRLDAAQLEQLRSLAEAEAAAEARGDRVATACLSGEFHRELACMHGNPVFLRLLDTLLPTTSMLMAMKEDDTSVCRAHRHTDLIRALADTPAAAAAEMRRHLAELERSLTTARSQPRPLRDAFAAYREAGD